MVVVWTLVDYVSIFLGFGAQAFHVSMNMRTPLQLICGKQK